MRLAAALVAAWLGASLSYAHGQTATSRWGSVSDSKPVPAALGGYCVVTLRDQQQWQPGDAKASAFFDGRRYQFATTRERDIFAAAPQTYAPMLGGDCPVAFAETGDRLRGELECGVLHGSRLVFFASDGDRQYFLQDPAHFTNVDLALGGRCSVSRRDHGKNVAGIPGTAAVHGGLRYLFASAHDRTLFLRNPGRYDDSGGGAGDGESEEPLASQSASDEQAGGATPGLRSQKENRETPTVGSREEDVILGALPAMSGYCPVTLRKEGAWVRGRYEYRVELGHVVFLTAGPKERDDLTSDPVAYAPALGGDCPVSLVAREERIRGSVYHAYEFEGRLFLFADAERKAIFKAGPAKYAAVDLAIDGLCVVTRVDEQRDVPGLAEFSTWYDGLLYRFSGEAQKRKFLAEPNRYLQ